MIRLTGNEMLSTISVSIFGLTYALSSLLAGVVHSIFGDELRVVSYSLLGMVVSMFLFYLDNPILFIVARALIGLFESFIFVGYMALLLNLFRSHEEGTYAIGKFFSIMGVGLVFGPMAGAIYVDRGLYKLAFTVSILLLTLIYFLVRRGMRIIGVPHSNRGLYLHLSSMGGLVLGVALIMVLSVGSVDGVIQSRSVIWFDKLGVAPSIGGILMTTYYFFTIITETLVPYLYKRLGLKVLSMLIIPSLIGLALVLIRPLSGSSGDSLYYFVYLSVVAFIFALDMGLISPMGSERLARSISDNYLIGSGIVNAVWSISYFITPSLLGFMGTPPTIDIVLLLVFLIMVLLGIPMARGKD